MVMARPSVTMVPGGGSADRVSLPRCAPTTGVAAARRVLCVRFNGRSARLRIFLRASQALTLPLPSSRLLRRVLLGLRGRGMQWLAGVWGEAGGIVGDAVCAAARRSGLETSFEWSVVGGIAQASDLLLPSLEQTVLAGDPSATRATSRGTSLDGAVRLLHLDGADIERFAPLVRSFTRGTQQ